MSIILLRHGETSLNVARTIQPADTPLSGRGLAQAQAVARRLVHSGAAAIVSSDLPRAMMTAQAVAAAFGLPIEPCELLQERNFGDLRGRAYDGLGFDPLTMADAPPGGESMGTFKQRVAQAFASMVRKRAALGGDLVVVTHGLVIRMMLNEQVSLAAGSVVPMQIGNTSVTIVAPEPPHLVRLMNCMQHLDVHTSADERSLSGG